MIAISTHEAIHEQSRSGLMKVLGTPLLDLLSEERSSLHPLLALYVFSTNLSAPELLLVVIPVLSSVFRGEHHVPTATPSGIRRSSGSVDPVDLRESPGARGTIAGQEEPIHRTKPVLATVKSTCGRRDIANLLGG